MDEIQIKNHEMDQSDGFDLEKNQNLAVSDSDNMSGQDHSNSKMPAESSTLKPLRKKRRQLTGW
jgi:hypothetical protein